MLTAVFITAAIGFDGQQYFLQVDAQDAQRARAHLNQYEHERLLKPPPPAPIPNLPNAWVGCTIYALVLIVIGLLISNGFWRLDAFNAGEIDAQRVQAGQWWRAWTALTLHRDGAHLIANLAAGIWFGYLAARQIGSGISWLLIITGAAVANLLEALLGPASHRSVGASTAVFTALGLLAAHSWRLRATTIQRWALRWAPLVGGVVLLGWFGTGGGEDSDAVASTDIVAHAGGFLIGLLLGAAAAQSWTQRLLHRLPQWLAGLMALASILTAWICALRS
jgi:membrane associated rhomboid family serine protease